MWLPALLLFSLLPAEDPVFYRSKAIPFENLTRQPGEFRVLDDKGGTVGLALYLDKASGAINWYRRLFTEVCLTGECRPVDIGIYWTADGKYLGIEVFRENLTKTDHSDFSDFDYRKLESVLSDEWSPLRELEFEELVEEKKDGVDATTGATKKVIADASVKDAVYTTYTMWHLIHVGEEEQLALLTYRYLDSHPEALSASLRHDNPGYLSFLIRGMLSGNLSTGAQAAPLILRGLEHSDPALKNTAFKAVNLLPLDDAEVQNGIARSYNGWEIPDKNRFLLACAALQTLRPPLYQALSGDLEQGNPWFLASLIPVLGKSREQDKEVIEKIRELEKTGNSRLKEAARDFLNLINSRE